MTEVLQAEIAALTHENQALKAKCDALAAKIDKNNVFLSDLKTPSPPDLSRMTSTTEAEHGITSNLLIAHADPTGPASKLGVGKVRAKKKIVYLVRHAEAVHNVLEAKLREEAKAAGKDEKGQQAAAKTALPDERFRDAQLSSKGQNQVETSGNSFKDLLQHTHYPMPQTVLVSPLRRTLMTASILFPGHQDMRAKEFIRERRTGFPCDERQAVEVTKPDFPHIDFCGIDEDTDKGFNFSRDLLETYSDVARRGDGLLPLIKDLDADVVAVISHKGFIRELLQDSWKDILSCKEKLKNEFSNAEVRVCEISWVGDDAGIAPSIVARSLKTATAEPTVEVCHAISPKGRLHFRHSVDEGLPSLRAGVATSNAEDAAQAIEEVWQELQRRIGGFPTVALVFGHCCVNAELVAKTLREKQPSLFVVGGSSMRGVIASSGRARFGILGFDGWAERCGVGSVKGEQICDQGSAQAAGVSLANQATQGQTPDLIIMCASAGYEEHILSGINQVCKGVRVFGGSAGNDVFVDGPHDAPWQMYGSLAGWGALTDGGVVILAIWLKRNCSMHSVLSHCYGATAHTGMITKAEGRDIFEIDGRAAGDVLLHWTGLSLPWVGKEFCQYAFAFEDRLVDFKGIGDVGQLQCFAATASEFGHCAVQLVHLKPSGVIGAIREVARKAKEGLTFEVRSALVVVCAGTSCLFTDDDFQKLQASMKEIAEDAIAIFTFGEQGNPYSGKDAFHGNNMLNFLFFG